jgi:aldose 1-epimerase
MKKHFLLAGFAALMLVACNNKPASELTLSGLDPVKFQTEVNNAKTALYTLKNKAGMEVTSEDVSCLSWYPTRTVRCKM